MNAKLDVGLALRPMIEADLPAKVRWANDPRVNEWIGFLERVDLEGTRRWFAGQREDPRITLMTITLDGRAIGYAKLAHGPGPDEGQYCGLAIGEPEYWGRGLGKQAAAEVLRLAFETLGWRRLWGYWPGWNARSIGLHEKLGFVREGQAAHTRRHADGSEHAVWVLAAYASPPS
ncbi:putative acetyltransferase [Plesiocystis pacifica SIR-1]|uniref:Putative acetyltransferase n=1 Tax=Plesiocystis pacifica SIR-1 TaxID=391625 RepID=A6FZK6_9BACT|nr:GNAT family N-acetyltransferase [Plesiocystis pacifica]EDM80812.1 putative acetyltransferase [Plesiocystis pacifica SIR-1]